MTLFTWFKAMTPNGAFTYETAGIQYNVEHLFMIQVHKIFAVIPLKKCNGFSWFLLELLSSEMSLSMPCLLDEVS